MSVVFRNLSSEAIENCITSLNFKVDEIVFFGYKDIIDEERVNIEDFLLRKCLTKSSYFDIDSLTNAELEELLDNKINEYKDIYFDMTGNEGLLQVLMTKLAYEKNIPMHLFDIWKNEAFNIDEDIDGSIFDLAKRKIKINIEEYIRMIGGSVKSVENINNSEDNEAFKKLADIKEKYNAKWNPFTSCLQVCGKNKDNKLHFYTKSINSILKNACGKINEEELIEILVSLKNEGLIENFRNVNGGFSFDFISKEILKDSTKSGNVLEKRVLENESKGADDSKTGVSLIWEGMKDTKDDDFDNEVDVIRLDGYILTFISCKDTKELQNLALYQLESVTRRFGGKYAKMKLVSKVEPSKTYKNRAKSIGIEVSVYNND